MTVALRATQKAIPDNWWDLQEWIETSASPVHMVAFSRKKGWKHWTPTSKAEQGNNHNPPKKKTFVLAAPSLRKPTFSDHSEMRKSVHSGKRRQRFPTDSCIADRASVQLVTELSVLQRKGWHYFWSVLSRTKWNVHISEQENFCPFVANGTKWSVCYEKVLKRCPFYQEGQLLWLSFSLVASEMSTSKMQPRAE